MRSLNVEFTDREYDRILLAWRRKVAEELGISERSLTWHDLILRTAKAAGATKS
jgi:hypothetical protein